MNLKIKMPLIVCCLAACVLMADTGIANDTISVIHSRKSVRHYTGDAVGREDLTTLLKAGMAAPSAVNKQPWVFIAVTDSDTLVKLAQGLPYTKMIVKAGACIVVCGDMNKALSGVERDFWIQDCSAASENILLAAESLGLGAVWSGMYPFQERVDHVRKVLGLPDTVIPLNVIAVGHPEGIEKPQDKFNPANIHWNKW
ncbi:MAG: nitroreductase family protein [Candidatus Omnitrophota bacterium]